MDVRVHEAHPTGAERMPADQPSSVQANAEQALALQQRLSAAMRRQTWTLTGIVAAAGILLFAFVVIVLAFFQSSPDATLLRRLRESEARSASITEALASAVRPDSPPAVKEAVDAAVAESQLRAAGLEDLQASGDGLSGQSALILQILGSGAAVALLGFLGLSRLNNIDEELQRLREFMFAQIRERVTDLRAVITSEASGEILSAVRNQVTEAQQASQNVLAQLASATQDLEKLRRDYGYLLEPAGKALTDQIGDIRSVKQAERLSESFRVNQQEAAARKALEALLNKEEVSGSPVDYHNAYIEAQRLDDSLLARDLVKKGLEAYPGHFELVGDYAQALGETGENSQALAYIESWISDYPAEADRGWRPIVFYADAVTDGILTPDKVTKARSFFESFLSKKPREDKAWANWALFEKKVGDFERHHDVLTRGVKHCPFSQELHYILGEFLLERGEPGNAVSELNKALQVDYQDQFQHDVAQSSLYLTLAQAYEADNRAQEAAEQYETVLRLAAQYPPPSRHVPSRQMLEYTLNRLTALTSLSAAETEHGSTTLAAVEPAEL